MQELTALLGILAALTAGVISPGLSFVMVARMAVSPSRSHALGGALGMAAGGVLFGSAAQPLAVASETPGVEGSGRSFWLGLSTQISNPKTAIVCLGLRQVTRATDAA